MLGMCLGSIFLRYRLELLTSHHQSSSEKARGRIEPARRVESFPIRTMLGNTSFAYMLEHRTASDLRDVGEESQTLSRLWYIRLPGLVCTRWG